MRDDGIYIQHIAECIRRIEENTSQGLEAFNLSHTLQDAVLRNLQTLSEATQQLSEAIKAKYPQIEWTRIAAFRNVLVHNYLGIDLEIIWKITQEDMHELKRVIQAEIEDRQ